MFGRYYNGGYSRKATGSLIGLQDKLTFGYLNEVEDELFIAGDWILLESKDYGGEVEEIEKLDIEKLGF